MKYELETIPIWDAYDLDTECPLCVLDEQAELRYVDFFLGNSVMAPEMRVEVNKTGFCPSHFSKLFLTEKNRHGLGLMTHTRLAEIMAELSTHHRSLGVSKADAPKVSAKAKKKAVAYLAYLRRREKSCMICDRLDYTLKRYTFTIVYLWQKDAGFRERVENSKGFCLHHLPQVVEMAHEQLGERKFSGFLAGLVPVQDSAFSRLEQEMLWFTQKFDHQNADMPWGSSKDALHRTLQKLSGIIMRGRNTAS